MMSFVSAADAWTRLTIAVTWQLAALVIVAWVCEKALRLREPRARHALWWFVLIAPLLMTPGRMALQRRQAMISVRAPAAAKVVMWQVALRPMPEPRTATAMPPASPAGRFTSLEPALRPVDLLGIAWLVGCALLALRLVVGHRRVRRLLAGSMPTEMASAGEVLSDLCARAGVEGEVALRVSEAIGSPVLYGWRRPTVVVPRGWLGSLAEDELRAMLAHEVAHVRRRDFLANTIQRLIEIPLFFHPGAWLTGRRIALAREELCDAWALSQGTDAASYARSLAAVAERTQSALAPVSLGIAEGRFTLLRRVEAIMAMGSVKRISRPLLVAAIAVGLVSAAALAVVQVRGKPESRAAGADLSEIQQLLSDMKQLAVAMQMYLQDSGGIFPPTDDTKQVQVALAPYMGMGSQRIFTRKLRYVMPVGISLSRIEDPAGAPVAIADDDPKETVISYADGHVSKVPKGTNVSLVKLSSASAKVNAVTFSGRVTDERGRPVAGAEVWLEVGSSISESAGPIRLFLSQALGMTGRDGRFRAAAAIKANLPYQRAGEPWECAIIAHHAQRGTAWTRVQGPKDRIAVSLVMEKAADLRGQVVDPEGRAIPDASAQIAEISLGDARRGALSLGVGDARRGTLWIGGPEGPKWARTRSDAHGRFTFTGLPAKASVRFLAGLDRGERRQEDWLPPDPIVDLTTQRGVLSLQFNYPPVIEGELLLPNGKPAEGIRVRISTEWKIAQNRYGTSGDTVETDKQGHFSYNLQQPATCVVTVLDKGYYAVVASDLQATAYGQRVALPAKTLQQGGTVAGRVLEADTGAPVKGLPVFCRPSPDPDPTGRLTTEAASTTDEQGRYHLVAPPGKAALNVSPEGGYMGNYRPVPGTHEGKSGLRIVQDTHHPSYRVLDIAPGAKLEEVDLFVRHTETVTGVVLGSGGEPVPGAQVSGSLDMNENKVVQAEGGSPMHSRSGPGGAFSLHVLPGIPLIVTAYDSSAGMARAARVMPRSEHTPQLTMQLLPMARVTGRVLTPDRQPAAHVQVGVFAVEDMPRPETDAQGRFNIMRGVRGAPFTVSAYVFTPREARRRGEPGFRFVGHSQPMEVPKGAKSLDVGDIVLESYADVLRREKQNRAD